MKRLRLLAFAALAFAANCDGSKVAFATKDDAESWFAKTIVLGSQCESLLKHNSKDMKVTAVGEETTRYGVKSVLIKRITIAASFGAEKTCPIEKTVICDDSGKVARYEPVERPCP